MPDPLEPTRRPAAEAATMSLERALKRAKWAILWERLWVPLAWTLTALGLFLAVSWLGLWLWLPPLGRGLGIFVFVVLTAPPFVRLLLVRPPSRHDRLRRLDSVSGLAHRPATAIADDMASPESDAWSKALWRAHVEQALARVRNLRAGLPAPRLPVRDPFALRALVLILVIATFFAAGGERSRRIAAIWDWQGVVVPPNFRLDAWVSPPTYTSKPPVILPGVRPGERAQAQASAVSVPVGSVLIIRASGKAQFDVVVTGGLEEAVGDQRPQAPAGTEERRFTIKDRGTATLRGIGNDDIVWAFNAIPDQPPKIALTKDPEPQARGALSLSYRLEDDYGVSEAHASFALKQDAQSQASAPRSLYGSPEFPLTLPQVRTRNGVGQTLKDLTEHPWAGAQVDLTLVARDDAGNEGTSQPFEMRLPERVFVKPLARALIEQRRDLALDADSRDRVLIALDALAIDPEHFTPEMGIFLGLRSIYWSLAQAKSDDQLRDVVQRLWEMATQLEDGNVSDAEARLRQAQEALRQALERGATDEETKKLMDELRAALDKFMQALA
ncbi:MAG TPA: TIGR02302 family protein, partial [Xanthobacteraceae bacterium]